MPWFITDVAPKKIGEAVGDAVRDYGERESKEPRSEVVAVATRTDRTERRGGFARGVTDLLGVTVEVAKRNEIHPFMLLSRESTMQFWFRIRQHLFLSSRPAEWKR